MSNFKNRNHANPEGVELQGYVRTISSNNNNNSSHVNHGDGGGPLNTNPAFVGDQDVEAPPVYNGNSLPDGSSQKAPRISTSSMNQSDDYIDESGSALIHTSYNALPFKNFSDEVRASADVVHFLSNTHLLLHVHESNPQRIVELLLNKMLGDLQDKDLVQQANAAFFTEPLSLLSNTIQGLESFPENGIFDFNQNWICATCTLPAVSEARVGIAVLTSAVNMGKNCQECRLVTLVLTPAKVKGTKSELERARTFGTMLFDSEFRERLLKAHTEQEFKDLFAAESKELALKHRAPSGTSQQAAKVQCGFLKGLIADIRRRMPHYVSDYTDGLCDKKSISKSMSCTMFLYFAIILPSIAFGVLNESNTKGVLNVEKVLYSQTFGGLIFALFGGTPHIVLLTTAPLAIYSKIIYNISEDFDLNFPAMYACVGLWNALFLVLYSIFDLSLLMQFSTRSSEEIFALFISIAFSVDAFKNTASNFAANYNAEQCEPNYNQTHALELLMRQTNSTDATLSQLPLCQRESSVLYLLLLLGTAWIGVMLYNFTRTPYLTAGRREVLADYSLPIAVVIMAFVGSYLFREVDMGKSFDEDAREGALFTVVDFSSLSVGAVFGAMGLGFCLSLLFFMDQNISAALVNAPQNKLKKGTAYHLDLLVIAVVNAVISVFAFPMVHAALPHSPLHVRALADVEERVVQGHIQQNVVRVRETRVTAIFSHILIGLSILIMFVLAYIPTPVLYGLFLYVAITALYDNQFFERITLFFTEQSAYPPNHYIRHVPQRQVHLFTLLQMGQLLVLCIFGFVDFAYLKMFFPVLIFLLIPTRHKIIPKIIKRKYVSAIDHHG